MKRKEKMVERVTKRRCKVVVRCNRSRETKTAMEERQGKNHKQICLSH